MPPRALRRALAAYAAELVAVMPVHLGAALRNDSRLGAEELGGGAAGLLKTPVTAQAQLFVRLLQSRHVNGEMRHAVQKAQEDGRHAVHAGGQRLRRQPPQPHARIVPHQDIQLPERQESALRVPRLRLQPPLVAALHVAVVERIALQIRVASCSSFRLLEIPQNDGGSLAATYKTGDCTPYHRPAEPSLKGIHFASGPSQEALPGRRRPPASGPNLKAFSNSPKPSTSQQRQSTQRMNGDAFGGRFRDGAALFCSAPAARPSFGIATRRPRPRHTPAPAQLRGPGATSGFEAGSAVSSTSRRQLATPEPRFT